MLNTFAWMGAALLALFAMSCGGITAQGAPELGLMPDAAPPYEPPSLTATIEVDTPAFALGGASFDLSAHPEKHEIRVSLLLGAPVASQRWSTCPVLDLTIDGARSTLPTRYSGVPMPRGVYDAVSAELTIDQVRAMSTAADVEARLCGDVVLLSADRLPSLRDFVRRFEEMATYEGPPAPAPPPEFDPENPDDVSEAPILPVSA